MCNMLAIQSFRGKLIVNELFWEESSDVQSRPYVIHSLDAKAA